MTTDDSFIQTLSLEEARSIIRSSLTLLDHGSSPGMMGRVFQDCKSTMGARAGYVAMLSPDGSENRLILLDIGDGIKEDLPSAVPITGPMEEMYRTDKIITLDVKDALGPSDPLIIGVGGSGNGILIPLRSDDLRGVMVLSDRNEGFTDSEARLAIYYGRMASLALSSIEALEASEHDRRLTGKKLELMGRTTRHDVLNHIMVLQGFLEISYDAGTPLDEKRYNRMLEAINRIKSIYDLQREFEAIGSREPSWATVSDVIEASKSGLAIPTDGVRISVSGPYAVWADDLLEKVFRNLMNNSLSHGEKVTRIDIAMERSGDDLVISVDDDGIGIPEVEKEVIFKMGFGKGAGHGLFMAKEILASYDMSIVECGEPGKGASFRITVPPRRWKA